MLDSNEGATMVPEQRMAEPEIEETALAEAPVEYTIDALAAHTGVPSRTIRFYQSKGALSKPEIRGRKAVYTDVHVARLELIGTLQERGLRIKAIRDLVQRIDSGDVALDEWLGLQDQLQRPWASDAPKLYTRDELKALAGEGRKHIVADLVRMNLVTSQGSQFLAESPALLNAFLRMEKSGIDLAVAKGSADLVRKHLAKLASAMVEQYVKHAGDGFGRGGSMTELTESFDGARPISRELVDIVFGQEMERVLQDFVASGRLAKLAARKR
jgi:DNA-binding transcriptional MerR regulator